ncbi:MAG: PilZ domain-containing protein [Nitrospirota bacterium]|jgi:hypothetical protein
MQEKRSEKRSEERTQLNSHVECSYGPFECEDEDRGPWKNLIADISHGGMGFYSHLPAEIGQVVKIFLQHVFTEPLLAEVRWCAKQSESYKIGVRLI